MISCRLSATCLPPRHVIVMTDGVFWLLYKYALRATNQVYDQTDLRASSSSLAQQYRSMIRKPKNLEARRSSVHAWGLFALEPIPANEMVIEYDTAFLPSFLPSLLPFFLPFCLSVCLSACLPVCLPACLSFCLSVCLFFSVFVFLHFSNLW